MSTHPLRRACWAILEATAHRDDLVRQLAEDGMSLRDIAEASGGHLSHGTVANILKRKPWSPIERRLTTEGNQQ